MSFFPKQAFQAATYLVIFPHLTRELRSRGCGCSIVMMKLQESTMLATEWKLFIRITTVHVIVHVRVHNLLRRIATAPLRSIYGVSSCLYTSTLRSSFLPGTSGHE